MYWADKLPKDEKHLINNPKKLFILQKYYIKNFLKCQILIIYLFTFATAFTHRHIIIAF